MNEIFEFHDRIELLENLPQGGVVAEVGVLRGRFSERILEIIKPKELHLIDRWTHVWQDGVKIDAEPIYIEVKEKFSKYTNVFIHRMDSVEAAETFPDLFFDWVYLDACHEYRYIKADIEAYRRKVKSLLIGHDFQSDEFFGTSVVRAVIETVQSGRGKLIALTSYDDIPRKEGIEEEFPWGGRPLSWVLQVGDA